MAETAVAAQPGIAHWPADLSAPLIEGTVGEALRRAAARFPQRPALAWAAGEGLATLTWAELLAEAETVAAWLLQRAAPGERVAIWSRNSLEWVLAEYGCALAGLVVAGWNPAWTDFECAHARDLTTPALLLAGHDTRGVPLTERALVLGAEDRVFPLEDLRTLARDAAVGALPEPRASDLFLIQFTSGTTGRAKGASLSHRAALNGAWVRAWGSGVDETDVWVNPSPMSHVGGADSMVLGALVTGACYTVMNRFEPGALLRLMRLAGATRTGGVPTMLLALLEHPDWAPGSIPLRSIGSGGAQVPPSLIERLMREFGCPVLVAYAQSECPMMSSCVPADPRAQLAATVGRPTPHVELKVVDPRTGETVAIGAMGEICVRGPIVMDGYYRMPEATAAVIDADGFLHTGDLGALDAQGYLRIGGRAREVIIRGGENIYPAEVEDALLAHPAVSAVAVVGVPDERWGQIVGAAVQLKPGVEAPSIAALEAHAATRLAHFKTPRRWLFVEAFPLTPSAKIRKLDVEQMFLEEQA
jgi:fatty-acyl-CoA synthase